MNMILKLKRYVKLILSFNSNQRKKTLQLHQIWTYSIYKISRNSTLFIFNNQNNLDMVTEKAHFLVTGGKNAPNENLKICYCVNTIFKSIIEIRWQMDSMDARWNVFESICRSSSYTFFYIQIWTIADWLR